MITYQDYLRYEQTDVARAQFVRTAIEDYKGSEEYQTARIAEEYDRCRNTTTMQYQKYLTDIRGVQYQDKTATVHRSTSNFFNIFTTQLNQYLLGNGVTWKGKVDLDNDFDIQLQKAGKAALIGGVSFGFWNLDHLVVFKATEFVPMRDEENGALRMGIKFWQLSGEKPLRATLYELDGYTDFLFTQTQKDDPSEEWQKIDDGVYMMEKLPYKLKIRTSEADGREIYGWENYPSFPIVPLWGNPNHQSELVGMREKIDAYDFILNGWEDDLDNAQIYWIIRGAGGMDDPDLAKFLDRLRTVKAAAPEDGQDVQPVTVNIPVDARERLLERLERQLYRDAMIMNPEDIAGGAATATQIKAAYERQNVKADQYEYCVLEFISAILEVAGKTAEASFTRSVIVNTTEEVQTLVQAASFLSQEYVTEKILQLLGDGDQAQEVLKAKTAEAMENMAMAAEMQNMTGGA